jgi:ribonuclease P/MRP protein subunit POP8
MSEEAEVEQPAVLPSTQQFKKAQKSHELFTCAIRKPRWGYALLELVTDTAEPIQLDKLYARSYCTAALRQFLGEHGVAIAIDILKVKDTECWLRVPRQDLRFISAALTAFPGITQNGVTSLLRLRACSDWLSALIGGADQEKLWSS